MHAHRQVADAGEVRARAGLQICTAQESVQRHLAVAHGVRGDALRRRDVLIRHACSWVVICALCNVALPHASCTRGVLSS